MKQREVHRDDEHAIPRRKCLQTCGGRWDRNARRLRRLRAARIEELRTAAAVDVAELVQRAKVREQEVVVCLPLHLLRILARAVPLVKQVPERMGCYLGKHTHNGQSRKHITMHTPGSPERHVGDPLRHAVVPGAHLRKRSAEGPADHARYRGMLSLHICSLLGR